MKKILLIGAGQLGSRHLQALSKLQKSMNITVIDPSRNSLEIAEQRFHESEQHQKHIIEFKSGLDGIHQSFDIGIIATNASVRLSVIEELLQKATVGNLILEKVLFQSTAQLYQAQKLLTADSVQTWVNCPRRMFPLYKDLRARLKNKTKIHLQVEGTDWGLACNAIHFIDLWAFLTNDTEYRLNTDNLIPQVFDSKRAGYKELYGVLSGQGLKHSFSLECAQANQSGVSLKIVIKTGDLSIEIDEIKKACVINDANKNTETVHFDLPYQSELTTRVVEQIMLDGSSELTSFEESLQIHAPFLHGMLVFFNQTSHLNLSECPIT